MGGLAKGLFIQLQKNVPIVDVENVWENICWEIKG